MIHSSSLQGCTHQYLFPHGTYVISYSTYLISINAIQFTYAILKISTNTSVMSRISDDPKNIKALVTSFPTDTRSTRAQGGNPYIPEGITLDEHYDLAMEAGMDPQEYVRRNYHGTSSSQPYPHQAHVLPPRRLVPRPATKSTSGTGSNDLLQRTSETMGISDSAIPPSKRAFLHSQEEELSFDNASSPPDDQTPHPPHTTISSVSAKTMPSPHLPLGELMV